MKLIFLDFDGVLNTPLIWWERTADAIDPKLVSNLQKIMDSDESIRIVISSTWRRVYTLPEIQSFLEESGLTCADKVIGKTTNLPKKFSEGRACRGKEIQEFLDEEKDKVSDYVILDDNSDMLVSQKAHFFQTDCEMGLTEEIANKVIDKFKGSNKGEL